MDKREEAIYEIPTEAAANYEIPVVSGTVSCIMYVVKSNTHHLRYISFYACSFQTVPCGDSTYLLR